MTDIQQMRYDRIADALLIALLPLDVDIYEFRYVVGMLGHDRGWDFRDDQELI